MALKHIVTVLRGGGTTYNASWVWAIRRQLLQHCTGMNEINFMCLSDIPSLGMWRVPLIYHWPGWWSKLEMFSASLNDLILYFDLDTLITADLSPFFEYEGDMAMLSDFHYPQKAQSGVMLFRPQSEIVQHVWNEWKKDPYAHMRMHHGDGDFINSVVGHKVDRLQNLFPDQIVSYKVHALEGVPEGARLVCGHGLPRFSDVSAGWAHDYWSGQ